MLVIRGEQLNAFKEEALRSFENEMVRHLFAFAPTHCEGIGEENVRGVIRLGVRRAATFGFTTRGPVRFYLELMFLFGSHFDTDPQLPDWATALLRDGTRDDQMQRADRLHAGVVEYLEKVLGPGNVHARRAVERFRLAAAQPLTLSANTLVDGLLALMQEIYPERYAFVGDGALRRVIGEGIATAQSRELSEIRGGALCSLLMFELGHGCFNDPLYPWIARTTTEGPSDAAIRTQRLERRVVRYIELILKRLTQE